jgi:DNA (cytosine-5)-methyltransferase 1
MTLTLPPPGIRKCVGRASSGRRRPVAVDLFAGIGGLSLGFEQAGFDVVASVEYDPVHAAVHAYNFPLTAELCADVSTLSADALRQAVREGLARHGRGEGDWDGEIDVVFGGPPCQGFSTMGKRLVDDKRNQLVFHFFRLVRELRPRYFVMENVPGMKAGGHSSILHQLIGEFEEAGYRVARPPQVLNAANYGAPQDRRRLILLGARAGERLPNYPAPTVRPVPKRAGRLPLPLSQLGLVAFEELPAGPSVWDALGDLPDLDAFDELWATDAVSLDEGLLRQMEERASVYARRLLGLEDDPADLSYPRQWDRRRLTSSMRTAHTEKSVLRFADTPPGDTEPISRFYRLDARGLSNTLRAGTGSERGAYTSPRPIHPVSPRVISVREAARLHSIPDWFRLHATKWHGFRQIGNAVPPALARAIGSAIAAALGLALAKPQKAIPLGDETGLYLNMSAAASRFGASPEAIPQQRTRPVRATAEVGS